MTHLVPYYVLDYTAAASLPSDVGTIANIYMDITQLLVYCRHNVKFQSCHEPYVT